MVFGGGARLAAFATSASAAGFLTLVAIACFLLSITNHAQNIIAPADGEVSMHGELIVDNGKSRDHAVPSSKKRDGDKVKRYLSSSAPQRRETGNADKEHKIDEEQMAADRRAPTSSKINVQAEMRRWRRQYRKFLRITSNERYQYRLVTYDDGHSNDLTLPRVVDVDADQKRTTPPSYPSIEKIFLTVRDIIQSDYTYTNYALRYNRKLGYVRSIDIVVAGGNDGEAIPLLRVRLGKFALKDDGPINFQKWNAAELSSAEIYISQWLLHPIPATKWPTKT